MAASGSPAPDAPGIQETRPGKLITTLFALYARNEGNWLSIASTVALMADLGVEGQGVRSSIYRLKRRGVLVSERRGNAAGYTLADQTLEVLSEGDVRIFQRVRASVDDGWVVVVFSVPESEREKRYELRTSLTRLGFGTVTSGVWVAPAHQAAATRQLLDRRRLSEYVDLFTGEHFGFGDLGSKVRTWWDLEELSALQEDFLTRWRPALDLASAGGPAPIDAFRVYVPMLTQWRRLPYRDPGLPLALLPDGWNGVEAGHLFDTLNDALRPLAQKHALSVIHG
ncbi:PaaX family transcriptional regulator C-terminal domain-containing protein [Geodermatophilus sp. DSM 44513]|uniref:PaaX family transcriptional regulator n=1 Tax=Geodermatophilus sp. DSM 44513 TaxID=1528104 RepID=UPI0012845558|nr:PaaX family transcriptional regulator C-terminal domain-containing protein [Geodermatophilus sp. DSM 44513]WNV77056.1 PaaX family transcriptional regulator C-terminal domain-containing protein [Geodermatophilus sp. DSM 44513]